MSLLRRPEVTVLASFGLSIGLLLYLIPSRSVQSDSTPPVQVAATPLKKVAPPLIAMPVRLKIPRIKVDAALSYVGLTPQGALAVPIDPTDAGWYDRGTIPGQAGIAVIDGHLNQKGGRPAVFDKLHKLRSGDSLYVEDQNGATTAFVVRNIRVYRRDETVPVVFTSTDGGAHLNLITCEGIWDEARHSYSGRLVVFADKQ